MNAIRIKDKCIQLFCRLGLLSKARIPIDINGMKVLTPDNAKGRFSSSNNIIELIVNGTHYYFRPIRPCFPSKNRIACIIDNYARYRRVSKEDLLYCIERPSRFLDMGAINDKSSRVYMCLKHKDYQKVGIRRNAEELVGENELLLFIHYAWSELRSYEYNRHQHVWQAFEYSHSRCQEELYRLFGISDLICSQELVIIKGNDEHLGTIMRDAGGTNPIKLNAYYISKHATIDLLLCLDIVNIMDVICNERDHRPGNYHLIQHTDESIQSVKLFDNDSPLSFFPSFSIERRFVGASPIVNQLGFYARPFIKESFVNAIMGLSCEDIDETTKPYINYIQRKAIISRFRKIKRAIIKTVATYPDRVVSCDNKRRICISDYLSRLSGQCYFSILRNWDEGAKDIVLLNQGKLPLVDLYL